MDNNSVIYVDVDDTLIRTYGTKQIPMTASVEFVKKMHAEGHQLYCWSQVGGEYARGVAEMLGISSCFIAFLPKPKVVLDDRGDKLLDYCEVILPGNAANY